MRKSLIIGAVLLFCVLPEFSKGQNTSDKNTVVALGRGRTYPIPEIALQFEMGFSDSLEIYLNGNRCVSRIFQTNDSLAQVENGTVLLFPDPDKENRLAIINPLHPEKGLSITLTSGYRILHLNYYSRWDLFYSNKKEILVQTTTSR